jgi:Fe-S cluster biogenesis protein NfuA/nitrite reductase/ring-hydroxylating ferredoxin subunit
VGARSKDEFAEKARRVESLVKEVQDLQDQQGKSSAISAIQALLELHGDAFARILELAGPEGAARVAEDPGLAALLVLHGVHPRSLEERVTSALEKVRPYLESHGGGVELLDLDEEAVHLRLQGSCNGCPSSTATLKFAIEEALGESAPELERVDVEGVVDEPPAGGGFVPLGSIKGPPPSERSRRAEWHEVAGLEALQPGRAVAREVNGIRIAFCVVGDTRYAYVDRCPSCATTMATMDGTPVDDAALSCPGCGHRYDVRAAGRGLDDPSLHLEPVPLLRREGALKVGIPAPAGAA